MALGIGICLYFEQQKEFTEELHDLLFRVIRVESLLGKLYRDIDGFDYDIASDFKIDSHPHMAYDGDRVTVGYRLYSDGDNQHMIERKKEALDRISGKWRYGLLKEVKAEGIRWELFLPFEPGRKCEGRAKDRILGMLEKERKSSREPIASDITFDIIDNTLTISMDVLSAKTQFYQSKKEWFKRAVECKARKAAEEMSKYGR